MNYQHNCTGSGSVRIESEEKAKVNTRINSICHENCILFIFFLEGRETFGFNFWRFYISPGQSSSAGKKLARSRVKGAGGFFSLVVVTFGPSKEKLSLIFTNEDKGMNITVPILSRYGH